MPTEMSLKSGMKPLILSKSQVNWISDWLEEKNDMFAKEQVSIFGADKAIIVRTK
jgi:hypothetical protein